MTSPTLSELTHDIRNELASAKAYVGLLRRKSPHPYLAVIDKKLDSVVHLLEKFTDSFKTEKKPRL